MSYKEYLNEINDKYQSKQVFLRNHDTVEEYIDYLEGTLMPDLIDSGKTATAEDFERVIELLKNGERDFKYEKYLKDTLIPDLYDFGMDATADDFKEGLYWFEYDSRNTH